jgi:leucyl/phenylalanyl-tRNA--protein transferase
MGEKKHTGSSPIIDVDLLLAAYAAGYFPMADSRYGAGQWHSPDPRAIIPLKGFKVSRSLRQTLGKKAFEIRFDSSFERVMRACADREETWISEDIVQSYLQLHRAGCAHSVETWRGNKLVGGLYGVEHGAAFFGESMFSRVRDASKVALVRLVEHLSEKNFELLDTQFMTPHLARFGAYEIPRDEYLVLLAKAVAKQRRFLD